MATDAASPTLQDFVSALAPGSELPFLFQTVAFVIVFTAFYGVYLLVANQRQARVWLLNLFSLYFYWRASNYLVTFGDADAPALQIPWFVFMVGIALFDWLIAKQIHRTEHIRGKQAWVALSLLMSLGMLAYFKYAGFFSSFFTDIAAGEIAAFVFPVGISYYTFKTVGYILDVFYEEIEPEIDFGHYLLYVSFFPTILAGPILRSTDFLPQIRKPFSLDKQAIGYAFFLFLTGLFKKLVIADRLAVDYVNRMFDAPDTYSGLELLIASFSYGFHLFADFSAYSDMAVAIGLLLGFVVPTNFNEPFKAKNISEFWRRWHMTLSFWFNDYVYTPLSFGWRSIGRWGAVIAVLVTFFLSGLWHGPNWTFVLWGTLHGVAIAWETATRKSRGKIRQQVPTGLYDLVSLLITFCFLGLTYVFFKADSLQEVGIIYGRIWNHFGGDLWYDWLVAYWRVAAILALAIVLHFTPTNAKKGVADWYAKTHWSVQLIGAVLMVVLIQQFAAAESQGFVYLQF